MHQGLSGEKKGDVHFPEPMTSGPHNLMRRDRKGLVTVLPMTAEDVREVHAIERDCFSSPWPRRAFLQSLRSRDTVFLTARADGRVVGYAGMRLEDGAHILNIAVHRDHRRKRIGSRLLSLLLDVASRQGATRVTLEVRASNAIARAMYRRLGFAPVAVRENYYVLEKEDALVMEKRTG
jgi:ribosomal-protein-alanine N-acetyltransferase